VTSFLKTQRALLWRQTKPPAARVLNDKQISGTLSTQAEKTGPGGILWTSRAEILDFKYLFFYENYFKNTKIHNIKGLVDLLARVPAIRPINFNTLRLQWLWISGYCLELQVLHHKNPWICWAQFSADNLWNIFSRSKIQIMSFHIKCAISCGINV